MAEQTPPTSVQRVHPGGFFWTVPRGDRLSHLAQFVAQTQRLAIVANAARDAEEYTERLRLSGVPVHVAIDPSNSAPLEAFLSDDASTLVATHEFALANGPLPASMTVHLRTALSVRDYSKRLEALPSAVHLTFVVPEDDKRAKSLLSHFEHDQGHGNPDEVSLTDVIDLTDSGDVAMVSHARRRFPLGR